MRSALLVLQLFGWSLALGSPRHLVYPPPGGAATKVQLIFGLGVPMEVDVSTIIGYVMKCNYNLPYNASFELHPEADIPGRYELYRMLGLDKGCLLRAVCQLAAAPLEIRGGLTAQLLHLLLTPSSTRERLAEPADQEYLAAESLGRGGGGGQCSRVFHECSFDLLDYFTRSSL